MSVVHPNCEIGRDSGNGADPCDDHRLLELYSDAITHAERALEVVEELITIVQNGGDWESQSAALQKRCVQIAEADARIQAAQQVMASKDQQSGQRILAEAERHLAALSRLCERIRDAEKAATIRLQTLSPGLDAAIRGKQMVTAYRQRSA